MTRCIWCGAETTQEWCNERTAHPRGWWNFGKFQQVYREAHPELDLVNLQKGVNNE